MTDQRRIPNGCTLFVQENCVGGHIYYSDEVGEVRVWDTSLVNESTLLAAMVHQAQLRYQAIGEVKYE